MGLFKVNVTALKSAELALMGVGVALYRFFLRLYCKRHSQGLCGGIFYAKSPIVVILKVKVTTNMFL
jgi:hypothetical protein